MYICIYVYVYTYIRIYVYVYVYIYLCIHTYIHTCVHGMHTLHTCVHISSLFVHTKIPTQDFVHLSRRLGEALDIELVLIIVPQPNHHILSKILIYITTLNSKAETLIIGSSGPLGFRVYELEAQGRLSFCCAAWEPGNLRPCSLSPKP